MTYINKADYLHMSKTTLSIRGVLMASAVVTFVIGISLLWFADPLVQFFGLGRDSNEHFASYLGCALIGFAITNYLYSKSKDMRQVIQALYGNLISVLIASIIDIGSLITRNIASPFLLIVILHTGFTVAFAYCIWTLRKQEYSY